MCKIKVTPCNVARLQRGWPATRGEDTASSAGVAGAITMQANSPHRLPQCGTVHLSPIQK